MTPVCARVVERYIFLAVGNWTRSNGCGSSDMGEKNLELCQKHEFSTVIKEKDCQQVQMVVAAFRFVTTVVRSRHAETGRSRGRKENEFDVWKNLIRMSRQREAL